MHIIIFTGWRLLLVVYAFGRFIILPSFVPRGFRRPGSELLRTTFEHLGATWIKLGQALSLRFDLLPAAYCRELLKIRSDARPLPFSAVREIIRSELGRFPEEIFISLDREPHVSTVLHQLHKARSVDQKALVVKVQRPEIGRLFATDIRIMRLLARLLDAFRFGGRQLARTFLDEFIPSVNDEIDYRASARNVQRTSMFSANDDFEVNVTVCSAYSTQRVLTTELIDGISLLEVLKAVQSADRFTLDSLAERGYDLRKIARHIHWNMLNQVYRDGLFHADLTPAGLLVLPGNAIAYVDFGMMGRITEELQDSLRFFIISLVESHVDRAIDEFLRWIAPSTTTNLDRFRQDLARVLEDYLDGFQSPPASPAREAADHFIVNVMITIRRHGLTVSHDMSLYLRALLTTDAIILELAPGYDLLADVNRFFLSAAALDAKEALSPVRVYDKVLGSVHTIRQLLRDISNIQKSGRMIEISLRTLQVRLFEYGLWALIVGGAAYLAYREEVFRPLQAGLGIDNKWISGALLVGAVVLLLMMWRQGRKLAVMDRTTVTRREVFHRSLGRVR